MKPKRIIISGGGTGGHIFPALSIANALKAADESIEILFVGALGRMEMEKVPKAGYNIVGLPVMGFPRKLSFKIFGFFKGLLSSVKQARKIIEDFKPDAVVGVGGYASGPVLRVASRNRIPCLIQEQNSYPGITNRMLAKKARFICVAYEGLEKYFPAEKIIMTGNPVRQDLIGIKDKRKEAVEFFGLNPDLPVVLSLGGSLGAFTINEAILKNIAFFENENIQLLWQTGKSYIGKANEAIGISNSKNVKAYDFIYRMDLAFSVADVVVSRAGASTISELCIIGKPAVFVPSPNVSEDHQTKNAMALVNREAAIMVKDSEAESQLISELTKLIRNDETKNRLSVNIRKLAVFNSAEIIARKVIELANEGK